MALYSNYNLPAEWAEEIEPGFISGYRAQEYCAGRILNDYPDVYSVYGNKYSVPYFVDDSAENVIAKLKDLLAAAEGHYVVVMNLVTKASQPARGGWRWHKWGPYLGKLSPQCEYLYDEPEIEHAVLAHIYEVEA